MGDKSVVGRKIAAYKAAREAKRKETEEAAETQSNELEDAPIKLSVGVDAKRPLKLAADVRQPSVGGGAKRPLTTASPATASPKKIQKVTSVPKEEGATSPETREQPSKDKGVDWSIFHGDVLRGHVNEDGSADVSEHNLKGIMSFGGPKGTVTANKSTPVADVVEASVADSKEIPTDSAVAEEDGSTEDSSANRTAAIDDAALAAKKNDELLKSNAADLQKRLKTKKL